MLITKMSAFLLFQRDQWNGLRAGMFEEVFGEMNIHAF